MNSAPFVVSVDTNAMAQEAPEATNDVVGMADDVAVAMVDDVASVESVQDGQQTAGEFPVTKSKKKKQTAKKKTTKKKTKKTTKKKTTKKKTKKKNAKKRKRKTTKKKKKKTTKKKRPRLKARRSIIKGSRSSWINFLSAKREELKDDVEFQALSFGEKCQKLSPLWQNASEEEKKPFNEMYRIDRQRYILERANLDEGDKKILRAHRRNHRKSRIGRPRAALSSYMLFTSDARASVLAENVGISFDNVGSELGRRWRALSDEEKGKYTKLAKVDRERFNKELSEWKITRAEEKEKLLTAKKEAKEQERIVKAAAAETKAKAAAAKAVELAAV